MKKLCLMMLVFLFSSCGAMESSVVNNQYSALGKPTIKVSHKLDYIGALDAKGNVKYDVVLASGNSKVDSYVFANRGETFKEGVIIQINRLTKAGFVWNPIGGKLIQKDGDHFKRNVVSASSLENDPYIKIYMKFLEDKGYSYGKSYCVVSYQKLISSNTRFSVYYVVDYNMLSDDTEKAQEEAVERSLNIFHVK